MSGFIVMVRAKCSLLEALDPREGAADSERSRKLPTDTRENTGNLKRGPLHIAVLLEGPPFRFHVSFPERRFCSLVTSASGCMHIG